MFRAIAACLLLIAVVGCVDGKELLAPPDPRYADMCPGEYEDYVCRPDAAVDITIQNPLCGISIVCDAP